MSCVELHGDDPRLCARGTLVNRLAAPCALSGIPSTGSERRVTCQCSIEGAGCNFFELVDMSRQMSI